MGRAQRSLCPILAAVGRCGLARTKRTAHPALACLVAVAAAGVGEQDEPALLQRALAHYRTGADMDCAYPNKNQWWASLTPDTLSAVAERNSDGVVAAATECLGVTLPNAGDGGGIVAAVAVLQRWVRLRDGASVPGTRHIDGPAGCVLTYRCPVGEDGTDAEDGCREGWIGEDCDRCAEGYHPPHCKQLHYEPDPPAAVPPSTSTRQAPPRPCRYFQTQAQCPERCTWSQPPNHVRGSCSPPPPPPAPQPPPPPPRPPPPPLPPTAPPSSAATQEQEEEEEKRGGQRARETPLIRGNEKPYEVLEVAHDATQGQIRKAFRKLSLLYHPDKWTGKTGPGAERAAAMFVEMAAVR